MTRWAELVGAATLLTRLPVGRLTRSHPPPGACVWAYPLIGAMVGLVGAGVLRLAMALAMPQMLAAVWAVAAMALLTGGLHEDGLADTADGFGGGRTTERKLLIMRDSRIGSYGAIALGMSVLLRVEAIGTAADPAVAIVAAAVLGRGAMLLPLLLLPSARPEGLGAALGRPGTGRLAAGLALAAITGWWRPASALAALLLGMAVAAVARRQVGGYTGDVLGAAEQAGECGALSFAGF